MSNYPSIPTPTADVQTLLATVSALKQVVEYLIGAVGNAAPAMRLYIQAAPPVDATAGDVWIRVSDRTLFIWNATGGNWICTL